MAGDHQSDLRGVWVPLSVAVGLLALALVSTTLMAGVWFWDTAEAQTVPPLLGTMHPTGFPAYVLLGWVASVVLQPFGDPAFRMNLLSALLVAASSAGTVVLLRTFRVSLPIAAAAGLALALTPIAWRIGSSADAHALHLALAVAIVVVMAAWETRARAAAAAPGRPADPWTATARATSPGARDLRRQADRLLLAAAALYGVLLANHALSYLLAPPIALWVLAVDRRVLVRPRFVAACIGTSLLVAALLYLELPLRAGPFRAPIVYGNPATWEGFWYVVAAQQFQGSIVDPFGDLGRKAGDLAALAGDQFGVLAWAIVPAFVRVLVRHPAYAAFSGSAVAITTFFAASYENAEIWRYYLVPAFLAWTWLAILATGIVAWVRTGRLVGRPAARLPRPVRLPRALASLPAVLLAAALVVPGGLAVPATRADILRSQELRGPAWLNLVFGALEPDAVVLSSWSWSTTLWYGQLIEGRRPDVRVIDDRTLLDEDLGTVTDVIDRTLGTRPVYVIRITLGEITPLAARYRLEEISFVPNMYRVLGFLEGPS